MASDFKAWSPSSFDPQIDHRDRPLLATPTPDATTDNIADLSGPPTSVDSILGVPLQPADFAGLVPDNPDPFATWDLNNLDNLDRLGNLGGLNIQPWLADEPLFAPSRQPQLLARQPAAPSAPPRPRPLHANDAPRIDAAYLPLTPDKTPNAERREDRAVFPDLARHHIVAHKPLVYTPLKLESDASLDTSSPEPEPTPEQSGTSTLSSEGSFAPSASSQMAGQGQSPLVTVSMWGNVDARAGPQSRAAATANEHNAFYAGAAAPPFPPPPVPSGSPVTSLDQRPDSSQGHTGRRHGLAPTHRPKDEVPSINQQDAARKAREHQAEIKNEVGEWLGQLLQDPSPAPPPPAPTGDGPDNIPDKDTFHETFQPSENKRISDQLYLEGPGGHITRQDVDLLRENRVWGDAPTVHAISNQDSAPFQPESSAKAIERRLQMYQETESVLSRRATWGTRRFSLSDMPESDVVGITSGNFFKKLSLSREPAHRPLMDQFLERLWLGGNPSKRSRNSQDEGESPADRKDSQGLFPGLGRSLSRGKKSPVPSINTAFVDMGSRIASIGSGASRHVHSHSINSISPAPPSRSPSVGSGIVGLSVAKIQGRKRSKSDIPKANALGLTQLWKKEGGGPPGPNPSKPPAGAPEPEDEEEDEEDVDEEDDMRIRASSRLIDGVSPTFAGFQEYVRAVFPRLPMSSQYLVDRIAQKQVERYKSLLAAKIRHAGLAQTGSCRSGLECIEQGGRATLLNARGGLREVDALSDGESPLLDGATLTRESLPLDIPMPPTTSMPAQFECQLCFKVSRFQKPSDWTKHVHEDVQPFACTWEPCKDPKIFKRKADWVRHENEGHRHLEWWQCDVPGCDHKCYRRDNFLQHLVREHKFAEPRNKTKAAIKKAERRGEFDPTWHRVDQCRQETARRPQDEPCRFCGDRFQTWKKLTVHLAKHMEEVTLPTLRLVERSEASADTIISPVQELPSRTLPRTCPLQQQSFDHQSPLGAQQALHAPLAASDMALPTATQPPPYMFPMDGLGFLPQAFNAGGQPDSLALSPRDMSGNGGLDAFNTQAISNAMATSQALNAFANPNQGFSTLPGASGPYMATQTTPVGSHRPLLGLDAAVFGPLDLPDASTYGTSTGALLMHASATGTMSGGGVGYIPLQQQDLQQQPRMQPHEQPHEQQQQQQQQHSLYNAIPQESMSPYCSSSPYSNSPLLQSQGRFYRQ